MASRKLGPVGTVPSAVPAANQDQSMLDLMTTYNQAVRSGMFDPGVQAGMPQDQVLAYWEMPFTLMARADELPPWVKKPELVETEDGIVPTVCGMDHDALGRSPDKSDLRQAVELMRSTVPDRRVPGRQDGHELSRADRVRMAERSLGQGWAAPQAQPDYSDLHR